jgi:N-methylhydantoinase A/oxoprolinase/acetone carboxylase beta subunit
MVAHSTTQATNALLEGDTAPLAVFVVGDGAGIAMAKAQVKLPIVISESCRIDGSLAFLRLPITPGVPIPESVRAVVIVQASAEGESGAEDELRRSMKTTVPIVIASEVSGRLGLAVRLKTAALNAAILPKMTETADFTEEAVRKTAGAVKLSVLRSDGGLMEIGEMRKRPIACLLSGPAAGAAAALHYAGLAECIFFEVGGTSTDISLIHGGKILRRPARVGTSLLHVQTLDLRTVGVGGGSLLRVVGRNQYEVGPRSAHIAGLGYLSFAPPECESAEIEVDLPKPGGPDFTVVRASGRPFGVTLTDAANIFGIVPKGDEAFSKGAFLRRAFDAVSEKLGVEPGELAKRIVKTGAAKAIDVARSFMFDYGLKKYALWLVGGGGGVNSLVPAVADELGIEHRVVSHCDVISSIGAALAVATSVREVSTFDPQPDEFALLRSQTLSELASAGIDASEVEFDFAYDDRAKVLRCTATGGRAFEATGAADEKSVANAAAASLKTDAARVTRTWANDFYRVFTVKKRREGTFRRGGETWMAVVTSLGAARLVTAGFEGTPLKGANLADEVSRIVRENTAYTDAGELVPEVYVIAGHLLLDFTSLATPSQIATSLAAQSIQPGAAAYALYKSRR